MDTSNIVDAVIVDEVKGPRKPRSTGAPTALSGTERVVYRDRVRVVYVGVPRMARRRLVGIVAGCVASALGNAMVVLVCVGMITATLTR